MNLDRVTVVIRPRNQWEAIDAGFAVARSHFGRLWLLWLATALPAAVLCVLLGWLLPGDSEAVMKWAILLFWLSKPAHEALLVLWIGRALFGEEWTIRQTTAAAKKSLSPLRILALWFRRLDPNRSFVLPVGLLEGLAGKARKQRASLLRKSYDAASYLTVAAFFVEIVLWLAVLTVIYWFIPEELRTVGYDNFVFGIDSWLTLITYFFACSLLAPFYVCGGFLLYISRRVQLEAWDIEIGFKRLEQRLRERKSASAKIFASVLLCCSLFAGLAMPAPAPAGEFDPQGAKAAIEQVMAEKEFGSKRTVYQWVPKEKDEKVEKPRGDWQWLVDLLTSLGKIMRGIVKNFALIARVLLWICAGGLLAYVLQRYTRVSNWLSGRLPGGLKRRYEEKPEILFGMDIRPESLPPDLESACRTLLEQGEKRQSLSLLYRGTLSRLVNERQLQIRSSYTEQQCCDVVRNRRPREESSYFSGLTALWLATAYGHQDPETTYCAELIGRWPLVFGA